MTAEQKSPEPSPKSKRSARRKTGVAVSILVILVAIGGNIAMVKFKKEMEKKTVTTRAPIVRIATVTPIDHPLSVVTHATVLPRTESLLVAQVSGRLLAVSASFEEGGFFEPGEILLTIEPADYRLGLTQAGGNLARAELHLAREKAEATAARQELRSIADLTPDPLALREPQVKEALAAVAAAEASVTLAQLQLERTEVRAPFAGRVRTKHVDVGQVVAAGSPLARIYAIDYAEVRLPIPLDELEYLDLNLADDDEVGPEVTLRAKVGRYEHEWTGRIVRTGADIDPRTRMIHAVARVADPYGRERNDDRPPLLDGLFVSASIRGRTVKDVVLLPREAIRKGSQVLVIDPPAPKSEVPSSEIRKELAARARDLFKDDTSQAKSLVEKLLVEAARSDPSDPSRFVLFTEARDRAAAAGEMELVLSIINRIEKLYDLGRAEPELQPTRQKLSALSLAMNVADTTSERANLAGATLRFSWEAMALRDFTGGREGARLAAILADAANNESLVAEATELATEADRLERLFSNPEASDPAEGHLELGRFFCIVRDDWREGLPLLAKGSNASLRELAKRDLATPRDAKAQRDLGAAWLELADRESTPPRTRHAYRARAQHWYETAIKIAGGLARLDLEKRLDDLRAKSKKDTFAQERANALERWIPLLENHEQLRFRKVDVLRYEGDHAIIRSGLSAGERVCVSPLPVAIDGMKVRIHEEAEKK